MEAVLVYLILLQAFSAGSEAAGLLPDGPLQEAVGDSVLFSPTKAPTDPLSVSWKFNDNLIISALASLNNTNPAYVDRITYYPATASLELRNLVINDSGQYIVDILSPLGELQAGSIILDVFERVSNVTVSHTSADLLEEDSVSLRCSSSSGSTLSFLWMNGSTAITASDTVQLTDGNRNLTITRVTRYDHGLYKCQVSNPVSQATSDPVNITVSYGPEDTQLTVSPNKLHHPIGSNITMKCSANSRPSPQFTWYVNSTNLTSEGAELKLTDVTMTHTGNYGCSALNPRTSIEDASPAVFITVIHPSSACTAGCIAGIVIACLVLVAGLVGSGVYFYIRKKKSIANRTLKDNQVIEVPQIHYENMPNRHYENASTPDYMNVPGSHYETMSAGIHKPR